MRGAAVVLFAFLIALRVHAAADGDTPELQLTSGAFRPVDGVKPVAPAWFHETALATSAKGSRYATAITRGPLTEDQRAQLESLGAEILGYLPVHGYRLRFTPAVEPEIRRLAFVAWLGALPAHVKIEDELAAAVSAPAEAARIRIVLYAGEAQQRVLDALSGMPASAAPSGKDGAWRVVATIPANDLAATLSAIASLPEVESVETARPIRAMNQDAVWVHQSFVGPSPQTTPIFAHGIFGCGQIAAIADTAQDYDLCYFRDTVNGPPPVSTCGLAPCPPAAPAPTRRKDILYYNWSGGPLGEEDTCPTTITGSSGHGTHTSGSIAADTAPYADCSGFTTPNRNGGDGMAPGAKLVFQEIGDGFEYLNDLGGTLWNLTDVAFQNGARIHSNSWGGACYNQLGNCLPACTMPYDSFARDADLAMWSHPDLLIVTAAGNGGLYCPPPISVGTPANAKNVLAAASVGHGAAAGTPSDFSAPGPVHDGRLGPTVATQGEATVSPASDANLATNNCASCSLDGTSMSAPTAAGLAALVREYYTAGFLAAGVRNPAAGFTPTGALIKATLIDGAVALGASAPGPDFKTGFGRVQLDRTLAFSGGPFQLRVDDHREGLSTGSVVAHAYDVSAGQPFRATLVWTDYPASLNAAIARVNELKLEVTDPSGTVWFQTLDPGTGLPTVTSTVASPHDTRNVVERMTFATPAAGRWIVRVRGVDVAVEPQPFALVVRGALADCPAPSAPASAPTLTTPAGHQVQINGPTVSGAAAYNVYRSFGACPGSSFVQIATVTSPSYLDTTVSGGVTYSYYMTATSDAAAACESPRSACASVVPTGDCFLPPSFAGATSAVSAGAASCAVNLSWTGGAATCAGDLRYNVYRGTTGTFTPGPANRIARCLTGSTFTDGVSLPYGATRWYVVRAEDATTGHGGPCRGGNEEANTVRVAAAADGPPVLGTWTDDAGDTGAAKMDPAPPWTAIAAEGNAAPASYKAASSDGVCADLTSPKLTLADPGEGPQLSFWTKHDLEYDPGGFFGAEGSLGQAEIATGPSFSNWTRIPLTPDYPEVVEFPFDDCNTTQNIAHYFTGIHTTYTNYTASLGNWAGGDVKLRFHLSGDYVYPGGSWWVDDISVSASMIPGACSTAAAGPPPVPDIHASRIGGSVAITWNASSCPAAAVTVYRGAIGNFATFSGAACNLPASGSATLVIPDNSWFLVAATDGATTDGSYGKSSQGSELSYGGASVVCPGVTSHVTNNACP